MVRLTVLNFHSTNRRRLVWLVASRLATAPLLMLLVCTIVFMVVAFLPGDLAAEILGRDARPETLASLRHQLGLDEPLLVRYGQWLNAVLHGNFGISLASGRSVIDIVAPRLTATLFLAGLAAVIATPLALALGIFTALWRDSLFDRATSAVTLAAISLPDFFVAYLFILCFAVDLGVFPSISNVGAATPWSERIWRALLPALTLSALVTAPMMRMTRAAIINTMSSPFIEMARLKGLSPIGIILRHVLPNVMAPVATVVTLNLGYLIVGVVIIEVVFAYPGIGQLLVDSVTKRDVPVVEACTVAFAVSYILLNLAADTIGAFSDPRQFDRN